MMGGVPLRPVDSSSDKQGTVKAGSAVNPVAFKARAAVPVPPRKIIPVIFVPGIMGSNLKVKTGREEPVKAAYKRAGNTYSPKTWTPSEGGSMLWRMKSFPPALRQVVLNQDNAEVDDGGPVDMTDPNLSAQPLNLSAQEAKERGWGEVMFSAYGPIIRGMERDLSRFMFLPGNGTEDEGQRLTDWWKEMHYAGKPVPGIAYDIPGTHSKTSPIPPNFTVTIEDIKKTGAFRFPVYACGYNWLESNAKSAKRLKERIEDIIKKYADAKDPDGKPAFECKHVIVVTHSMGGLVGRMAAKLLKNESKENKILGIVHGEMPALGAPVLYRRMACGSEAGWDPTDMGFAHVAGATGATATPVLAFSPGGMQLAATPDYPGPWLLADLVKSGKEQRVLALPAQGDPYGEIFLAKGKWYCPAVESLLDPADQHRHPWEAYKDVVSVARLFHKGAIADYENKDEKENFLGHYYHPNTYVHYGADPEIATFPVIRWRGEVPRPLPSNDFGTLFQTAPLNASNGEEKRWVDLGVPDPAVQRQLEQIPELNGTQVSVPNARQEFKCLMSSKGAESSGDGTVPTASGAAPGQHGVSTSKIYKLNGFKHQDAYGNVTAQEATFFAIVDMVKNL